VAPERMAGAPVPPFGRHRPPRAGSFVGMQLSVRPQLDAAALAGAVGPTTYQRGAERMRHGGVVRLRWDESRESLHGAVRGSAGELYTTTVYFAPADGAPLRFEQGICTCPVAVDCKHAVALTYTAVCEGTPRPAGEAFDFRWFDVGELGDVDFGFGQDRVVARVLGSSGRGPALD